MNIKSLLLIMLTVLSMQSKAQPNGNSNVTGDLDVPNFIRVYSVDAIGGEQVETYKNNSNQYFYNPLIIVDWNNFKVQLDKYKTQNDNTSVKLILKVSHYDKRVYDELKMLLERDENVQNIKLSSLPYTYYVLKAKVGEDYVILNPTDLPTFSTIGNFQTKHMISVQRNYVISGKLKDLNDLYNFKSSNDYLKGSLYTGGFEYSSDYVKGSADFATSTTIEKKLFGDETLIDNQVVNSSSGGGGLSLSVGPLKLGGGKIDSKVWTENEKKRILNRNYVSDLISNNQTEIHILSMGDADRVRETKTQIINYLLDKVASQVTLEFKKISDKEYDLVKDNLVYATLKGEQVETLLKAKPQSEITTGSKQSGSVAVDGVTASGSKEDNISQKGGDDITWQYKGSWVPTKVDMYILSEYQLKNSLSIDALSYNKEGKKTIDIAFIYPAVWLDNNSSSLNNGIVDRDNPIGTILAFAGNVDKIPAGWKLCNGDALPIHGNEEIFNVIGYNWSNQTTGDFNLPDLRGAFLRGLDKDKRLDPVVRTIGSFQGESFLNHTHKPFDDIQYFITQSTPKNGGGQLPPGGVPVGVPKTTGYSDLGGDETRPDNYAVNYIIRVK